MRKKKKKRKKLGLECVLGVKTMGASPSSYIVCFLSSASERKLVNPRLVEFTYAALALEWTDDQAKRAENEGRDSTQGWWSRSRSRLSV